MQVFWNSRLGTEHNRISTMIPSSDTVFDVCAGVGPFAIPLAKKGKFCIFLPVERDT